MAEADILCSSREAERSRSSSVSFISWLALFWAVRRASRAIFSSFRADRRVWQAAERRSRTSMSALRRVISSRADRMLS